MNIVCGYEKTRLCWMELIFQNGKATKSQVLRTHVHINTDTSILGRWANKMFVLPVIIVCSLLSGLILVNGDVFSPIFIYLFEGSSNGGATDEPPCLYCRGGFGTSDICLRNSCSPFPLARLSAWIAGHSRSNIVVIIRYNK